MVELTQDADGVDGAAHWAETLPDLLDRAWSCLERGPVDRDAAARHPTLATIDRQGWPEARTVVLRSVSRADDLVEVHTDLHSPKVASLRATPRAALHVWDAAARLQIRLQARVEILTGPEVAETWAQVPDHPRQSYGIVPPPGTPIGSSRGYRAVPDPATFAVLRCHPVHIDLLHLGDVHRRARFLQADGWTGQWLAP